MNLFNLLESAGESASNSAVNPTANPGGFGWQTWLIYGVLMIALIAMFIMSSKRRKKQQEEMQQRYNSLAVGDTIKTIGMICGTIVEICDDGTIVLLTGSETYPSYIRIDKQAIYQFAKKQEQVDPFDNFTENNQDANNEVVQAQEEAQEDTSASTQEEVKNENAENSENIENTEN